MQYIKRLEDYRESCQTVVTLGKFDGLHLGHELLMSKMREYAGSHPEVKSVVFFFDMSELFKKLDIRRKTLMTNEERAEQLKNEVDFLVECPFTEQVQHMEAEDFIKDILVGRFQVRHLVVGTDNRFGHEKRGDYHMLRKYADVYGYTVDVVEKLRYHDREISSTYIRDLIKKGDIATAAEMLGHPYFLRGKVEHGRELGRKLGFPTMNVRVPEDKLMPPNGVYAARGQIDGIWHDGIVNVGKKPTVQDNGALLAELHLFDYCQDVYEKEIDIAFYEFERPEEKFGSVEELQKRMQIDIAYGKEYFRTKDKRR